MRLLIDMDSVLVQLLPTWLRWYNEEFEDTLAIKDITAWDMHSIVKPECGHQIYKYLDQPGAYRDLAPMPGGPLAIDTLLRRGHEVFIVTSPPYTSQTAVWDKLEWVREHLPFFDESHVIFCRRKFVVAGDVLFDDCPTHLKEFTGTAVAMDYAYNRGYGDYRVETWPAFLSLVEGLKGR